MTISTKTFQNLQPGVSAADDLRVRTPINQALQWLGEGLANELNAEFASISASLSNINAALAQISQSVSVQVAAAISVYVSTKPTFFADKNGTNQTSLTSGSPVQVTFGTERWDIGDYFASSTWTPPAGKYRITVAINWSSANGVDNELLITTLRKNGAAHRAIQHTRAGTGAQGFVATFLVEANGTDAFDVTATKNGAGDGTIIGSVSVTWFCGEAI
jgi:hypothetical protein